MTAPTDTERAITVTGPGRWIERRPDGRATDFQYIAGVGAVAMGSVEAPQFHRPYQGGWWIDRDRHGQEIGRAWQEPYIRVARGEGG